MWGINQVMLYMTLPSFYGLLRYAECCIWIKREDCLIKKLSAIDMIANVHKFKIKPPV